MTDVELIKLKLHNILQGCIGKKLSKKVIADINKNCTEVLQEHSESLLEWRIFVQTKWDRVKWYKRILHILDGTKNKLKGQLHVDLYLAQKPGKTQT